MVIDYVMRRSQGDFGFTYKCGTQRTRGKINDVDYADDIGLLEESIARASEQLHRLSEEAMEVGLEISIKKTECVCYNIPEDEPPLTLNGQVIERVENFKYLGSMMLSTKKDIQHR